ncbi:HET-domain-containing protein [Fusarium austroafricanum]|uniref:HET-domain-containing protein n=1 Tax=Fusarium austroafricanum TaxID=2364996 RepID=A0A8H4NQ16_9HYPO|nr:HET-domain-containing protein [Fusarium austroafricanum]
MSSSKLTWVYRRKDRAKDVSKDAIDEYKNIIRHLYLDQNMTRVEVLSHLKDNHGFTLSTSQFAKATKRWGLYKQPRQAQTLVQALEATIVQEPVPPGAVFDIEVDALGAIAENETSLQTGIDLIPDSNVLENIEDEPSSSGRDPNGKKNCSTDAPQRRPRTDEYPWDLGYVDGEPEHRVADVTQRIPTVIIRLYSKDLADENLIHQLLDLMRIAKSSRMGVSAIALLRELCLLGAAAGDTDETTLLLDASLQDRMLFHAYLAGIYGLFQGLENKTRRHLGRLREIKNELVASPDISLSMWSILCLQQESSQRDTPDNLLERLNIDDEEFLHFFETCLHLCKQWLEPVEKRSLSQALVQFDSLFLHKDDTVISQEICRLMRKQSRLDTWQEAGFLFAFVWGNAQQEVSNSSHYLKGIDISVLEKGFSSKYLTEELISMLYLDTIEDFMTTQLSSRDIKREFLQHFTKHHTWSNLEPEDNGAIKRVQNYQQRVLDDVIRHKTDAAKDQAAVQDTPQITHSRTDVRMTNSALYCVCLYASAMALKFLSRVPGHLSTPPSEICPSCKNLTPKDAGKTIHVEVSLSQLQKSSSRCAHCKLMRSIYDRYNISIDCIGIIVDCTAGQPAILKFKDTLNDQFASWYLLYKPQGATIPSWPSLGGPGESLGNLGSEQSIKFLKDHLDECLNGCDSIHAICKQPDNKPLPKRALDVRGEKVKLCDTDGQFGDYCALSYRWGPPEETLRTTDSNISDVMSGIELTSFPKLLQDAVTLTRRLDVPYLWIDALCIIQGNKQDWEAEAPKMGEYYKNAILTIAASLANQVAEPFLVPREEISQDIYTKFDFANTDGTVSQVIVRRVPDYAGIPLVANAPLSTRAWTWQENVLSTRIAHFSKTEIVWECRSQQAFENGAKLQCAVGLAYRFARAADDLEYYWKALVTDYSKRELTYESDRLPAISSVASHYNTLMPGRYLAGVWEQWLFSDMAWMSSWGVENAYPPAPKKSTEMPSWSWASITGQVHFALETCVDSDKMSSIRLIDVDCAPSSGNPFMQPKEDSSIVVQAPMCLADLSARDVLRIGHYEISEGDDGWGVKNILKNRRKQSGLFHPDTVLLPDGEVTTAQGTFTSTRRARKDEVTGPTALKTKVFCLHLGGGRYSELPNKTLPSIARYKYTHFWLVLAPIKEQKGFIPESARD